MRAVVLVGGFGTRLRPLTLTVPKPMLPVGHVSIIERLIANLVRGGVTEVTLALGFKPEPFVAAFPDGTCAGATLRYAVEPEPLDTAGAIRFAAVFAGIDDTFVVANGDVLTDLDIGALSDFHHQRGAEGTIALTRVDDPSRYGVVPIDEHGRVESFVEKPLPGEAPTNWINAGTYVLEPSVIARIPAGRRVSIERETFPEMVADGSLFALHSDAYWADAGTPATYLRAQLDLIGGVRGLAEAGVHPTATVSADATVEHAVIMAGASVDAGAVVRNAVVLGGAHIGRDAVIDGSIVGAGAEIGDGAHVLDLTVVGHDVTVPAGAQLSHARVPEDDPS